MARRKSPDHVALGRAVRELRERCGVTQDMLVFDAGVSGHYVNDVECARLNPSFGVLLRIVRTLGSSMAELVEVYDRHLAEIDPDAGQDTPLCPTPEARAYQDRINARYRRYREAAAARGRMRSWT